MKPAARLYTTSETEADTCRKFVVPKLQAAGWDRDPHAISEQISFTDGRVTVIGSAARRGRGKRADYLLHYTPDFPLAVVEAKKSAKRPGDGLQQAKEYAQILGLVFAYSTNGEGIIEFDALSGAETEIETFPTPDQLWQRLREHQALSDAAADQLLTPSYTLSGLGHRYYWPCSVPPEKSCPSVRAMDCCTNFVLPETL